MAALRQEDRPRHLSAIYEFLARSPRRPTTRSGPEPEPAAGFASAPARPGRRALVDEGLHALERGLVHHVAGHRLAGVVVGGRDAAARAGDRKRLAQRDRDARLGDDAGDQRLDLGIERSRRDDAVDQAPCRAPASASMKSPVTSISNAGLRGTLRDRATPGVEQNRPTLTPLTAKRASLAATARSHIATSWQPAAVAMPCTRAITGSGRRCTAQHHAACTARTAPRSSQRRRGAHLASGRGRRRRPCRAAASTTTRAVVVGRERVELRLQRGEHAFRQRVEGCGRFSVSVTTPRASRCAATNRAHGAFVAVRSERSLMHHSMAASTWRARAGRTSGSCRSRSSGSARSGSRAAPCSRRAAHLQCAISSAAVDLGARAAARRRRAASRPISGPAWRRPRRRAPPGGGRARPRPRASRCSRRPR